MAILQGIFNQQDEDITQNMFSFNFNGQSAESINPTQPTGMINEYEVRYRTNTNPATPFDNLKDLNYPIQLPKGVVVDCLNLPTSYAVETYPTNTSRLYRDIRYMEGNNVFINYLEFTIPIGTKFKVHVWAGSTQLPSAIHCMDEDSEVILKVGITELDVLYPASNGWYNKQFLPDPYDINSGWVSSGIITYPNTINKMQVGITYFGTASNAGLNALIFELID